MTLSETVGEEIISVAICGGSFHSLPGLLWQTPKSRICFYSEENDINLLIDLEQMVAI